MAGNIGSTGTRHGAMPSRPNSYRADNPATHQEHLRRLNKKTAAEINKESRSFFLRSIRQHEDLTPDQCKAVQDAFKQQLPYVAPENKIPHDATVDSILAEKNMPGAARLHGMVRYGNVTMSESDSVIFEKFQRELYAIDKQRAVRQLYQFTHGHMPSRLTFSTSGLSAALRLPNESNLININTAYSILDPKSGTVTPLSIIMGHEIEHANAPAKLFEALQKTKDANFTNAEEIRTIDGYENGMLNMPS